MKSFENHIDIDAVASIVWALTIDVESWPRTFPTVTTVERLDAGAVRVASRARIKQPGQPRRVWTVIEIDPERKFVWSTRAKGFTMTASHLLVPTSATRTTNILKIDIDGPLASLVAALTGRKLLKTLATENEGFRTAAGRVAAAAAQPETTE